MTLRFVKKAISLIAYHLGQRWPALQKFDVWRSMIQTHWPDIEYFDDSWRERIRFMAKFIPAGTTVLDLGCGKRWLSELVGEDNYTGVDYRARGENTVVCDFNKRQFPELRRDVAFVSGCLEYVSDHRWFIAQICEKADICILSYCPTETHPDLSARRRLGWVNDLTVSDIRQEFGRHQFGLAAETATPTQNAVLVFRRERESNARPYHLPTAGTGAATRLQ
jgi:hypothetical protein